MRRFSGRLVLSTTLLLGVVLFYLYPKGAISLRSIPDLFVSRHAVPEPQDLTSRLAETESALRTLQEENSALKRSLGVVGTINESRLVARILWKDPDPGRQALRIAIPEGASVHIGDTVVAPGNILIGVITSVFSKTADVLLATDNSFKVGARLEDNTGLALGRDGRFEMKYLLAQTNIVEGAAVYTSGSDSKVPADLLLGWTEKVSSAPTEPFISVSIRPAARMADIRTLFILPYTE